MSAAHRVTLQRPVIAAAIKLIGRTGAKTLQLRCSDEKEPVVWIAVGAWQRADKTVHETAAGLTPQQAVLRLCAQVVDGGQCTYCSRPSGFSEDLDRLPLDELVCWYQWDPELGTFRRGCEGDAA